MRFIKTLRVVDILGHEKTSDLTREEYHAHAECYGRELIASFAPRNLDLRAAILSKPDTYMTYYVYG